MNKFLLFLGVLLLATSCASKKYTKKGAKFEEAGLYQDAAEYYYVAVKRKDSNVDAKLGLRKNGQLVLEQKLSDFNNAYKQGNYKEAVYKYQDSETYYNKVKNVGVNLEFPEINKSYYDDAKEEYLDEQYAIALEKLNREDFDGARIILLEIINIDDDYKDANEKFITARFEPLYREGLHLLDLEQYRKAYYTFDEILTGAGNYKQAISLKEEALEKGTLTILVSDFVYAEYNERGVANALNTRVKGNLSSSENPFIRIIEPETLSDDIYDNGELNMEAAVLIGIKTVLSCEINGIASLPGELKKTTQRGYVREVKKLKNEAGEEYEQVNYHKTIYQEYEVRNESKLDLSFTMKSTESGEVLVSDVMNLDNFDETHYIKYKGDKSKLVPGYWKDKDSGSPEDIIKDKRSDLGKLKKLFDAKQSVKSTSVLMDEMVADANNRIVKEIETYNSEIK